MNEEHRFSWVKSAFLWTSLASSCALAQTAPPPFTTPAPAIRQAWASKDGLIKLHPVTGGVPMSEVADRLAIQEMFGRWAMAFDEGQSDVVRSLFTKDAVFLILSGEYHADGVGQRPPTSGRDAIATTVAAAWSHMGNQRRHLMSDVVVERLTHDEATVDAYALVAADGHRLEVSVIYTTNLRREADGAWRFSRMVIGMDTVGGAPQQTAPPAR